MSVVIMGRLKVKFDDGHVRLEIGQEKADFPFNIFVRFLVECWKRIAQGYGDDSSREEGFSLQDRRNVVKRATRRLQRLGKYLG